MYIMYIHMVSIRISYVYCICVYCTCSVFGSVLYRCLVCKEYKDGVYIYEYIHSIYIYIDHDHKVYTYIYSTCTMDSVRM